MSINAEPENHGLSYTKTQYTVGWICALSVEFAASNLMLDEVHPSLPSAEGDKNAYTLGRIGSSFVVMTVLPHGTMGANAAATVARDMNRTFTNLRFILMVGIGGGAPDPDEADPYSAMHLGDVVVCKPGHNSGGVIQYDFGKLLQDGVFKQTGFLDKPPASLRSWVSALESKHLIEDSLISTIITDVFQSRRKAARSFRRPLSSEDNLFEATYSQVGNRNDCQDCDRAHIIPRDNRPDQDPIIHYGLIASSNQVVRDAATRERLRKEYGVLCFEMEAAGLMDNFPCLVIRGICDYADFRTCRIVAGSHRPITICEMALALSVMDSTDYRYDENSRISENHLREHIRSWCGLFVFTSHSCLYLIHQTAREFLLGAIAVCGSQNWKFTFSKLEMELTMTRVCTGYLTGKSLSSFDSSNAFDNEDNNSEDEYSENINSTEATVWNYAAEYWHKHAHEAQELPSEFPIDMVIELYNTNSEAFQVWLSKLYQSRVAIELRIWTSEDALENQIRLTAFLDHYLVLKAFIKTGDHDLNALDNRRCSALYLAASLGHSKIVRLLLESDASIDIQSNLGSALFAASGNGYEEIVRMLIDKGADINSVQQNNTALGIAIRNKHTGVARMLIQVGADVNVYVEHSTALYAAVVANYETIVQMLLERGADVNIELSSDTVLQAATRKGNTRVLKMLLDRGADPNAVRKNPDAPLFVAARAGNEKLVRMLIDKGADVDHHGVYGTAFQVAVRNNFNAIVQHILEKIIDMTKHVNTYSHPLVIAASRENREIVQILLTKITDIKPHKSFFVAAMKIALFSGREDIADMLDQHAEDLGCGGLKEYVSSFDPVDVDGVELYDAYKRSVVQDKEKNKEKRKGEREDEEQDDVQRYEWRMVAIDRAGEAHDE